MKHVNSHIRPGYKDSYPFFLSNHICNNCLAVVVCTFVFVFVFIIVQVVRKRQMTSFISKLMDSKNLKKDVIVPILIFVFIYVNAYMYKL